MSLRTWRIWFVQTRPVVFCLSAAMSQSAIAQTAAPPAASAPPAVPIETPDTPGAMWTPAAPNNFQPANRPVDRPIDMIVIHDIEGTALGAVSWFQNSKARVSAHYVVDASEGRIWQMVKERDIGWHAGNRDINARSVGIEHEGFAYRPGFYSAALYEASARLVRSISLRHNIPRDRTHIIGHHEVPHPTRPGSFGGSNGHTDPGPYWDWQRFMTLVRNDARLQSKNFPAAIRPGEMVEATATFLNSGDDAWPAATGRRNDELQAMGPVYLGAWEPVGRASPFFHIKTWTSPRLASPPRDSDTAAGATGRFVFSLQGPRTPGVFTESFRLMKVPVAPREPVAFGEAFSVVLRVEPWDITSDAAQAGFAAPGWEARSIGGQKIFWRRATPENKNQNAQPDVTQPKMPQPDGAARWKVELPINGEWDVYARWPLGTGRSARVWYEVAAADGVHRIAVDQSKNGDQWMKLGRFRFDQPKAAAVTLLAAGAPGVVVADAVRFAGPFPAP